MKTADILQNPTIEYAVLHPQYTRVALKDRTLPRLSRHSLTKVTMVNTKRYNPSQYARQDASVFMEAPAGAKTYGFLMTDGSEYFVAKPADFITPYAEADAYWTEREAERARMDAIVQRRDAVVETILPAKRVAVQQSLAQTKVRLNQLVGGDAGFSESVYVSPVWVKDETVPEGERLTIDVSGDVRIKWSTLQRLLQTINELEEELG